MSASVIADRPAASAARTTRPAIVCITPVLNEEWILERFIACAATWADHIVIADQGSTDRSRDIARAHPKVILVENTMERYDEGQFRSVLLRAARAVPGPRVLIGLDADEALTANWETSPEWQTLLSAPPGTVITFRLLNVYEGAVRGYIPDWEYPFGFADDDSEYVGDAIHTWRIPMPTHPDKLALHDVKIMHFAASEWTRYKSRQRWYQCFEVLNRPPRRPVAIWRQYHSMDNPGGQVEIAPQWIEGYRRRGIDLTSVRRHARYRWDGEVLDLLATHGAGPFRRLDVWDVEWRKLAAAWGKSPDLVPRDPRSRIDRLVIRYLRHTQGREFRLPYRWIDRALRVVGW